MTPAPLSSPPAQTPAGQFELLRFPNAGALAISAATRWLDTLLARPVGRSPACIGLPGGRIIRNVFSNFSIFAKPHGGRFDKVHFFWGDERCVPPDHAESNFALANEFLLQPLGIAKNQIHRIPAEEGPENAAAQAGTELRRFAPLNAAGQPVLDLILLGMGEDGHVASLFPGESEATAADPKVYRAVTAPKPPPRRVTLGYQVLAAAREVWVRASGPGKGAALEKSLLPEGSTPLAKLIRMRELTLILAEKNGA